MSQINNLASCFKKLSGQVGYHPTTSQCRIT